MSDSRPVVPAPSGRQWLLRKGNRQVTVVEIGGGLREYLVDGEPVLDGFAVDTMASGARGMTLAPWPNRLRDGHYRFGDRDHQLPLTEPGKGNAIHGLVRWRPWTEIHQEEDGLSVEITLLPQPGYPFSLHLHHDYRLGDDGLTVTTTATNVGAEPLPYGLGFHPYLTAAESVDDMVLTVPAREWIAVDDRGLPTGIAPVEGTEYDFRAARRIGSQVIDTAYHDVIRDDAGRATVVVANADSTRTVGLWSLAPFHYLQIFTGDTLPEAERRRGVGVEPMTCAPDAFNSGDGLITITPGASATTTWGIWATLR